LPWENSKTDQKKKIAGGPKAKDGAAKKLKPKNRKRWGRNKSGGGSIARVTRERIAEVVGQSERGREETQMRRGGQRGGKGSEEE